MSWITKKAAEVAVGGITDTLKTIDGMTTSQEEKSMMRKEVFLATLHAHSALVQAEINSGTGLARIWRPVLMLSFGGVVVGQYLGSAVGLAMPEIPEQMWSMLTWSITGLAGFRTLDKIAPQFTARQLRKLKKAGVDTP